jgi:hypothetical protein
MENIEALQECVKSFIENKLEENYNFYFWKDILVDFRNKDIKKSIDKWSFFGGDFCVVNLIPDVRAIKDEWTPSLHVDFQWRLNRFIIPFRAILVKDKVLYTQLVDMFNVMQHFGDDFDFANQFQKNVVLLDILKRE